MYVYARSISIKSICLVYRGIGKKITDMQDFEIEGIYYLQNNKLVPKDKTKPQLDVRHRSTPVKGKPELFIAIHHPEFRYISSLFDSKQDKDIATKSYILDIKDKATRYKLSFEPQQPKLLARIQKIERTGREQS